MSEQIPELPLSQLRSMLSTMYAIVVAVVAQCTLLMWKTAI